MVIGPNSVRGGQTVRCIGKGEGKKGRMSKRRVEKKEGGACKGKGSERGRSDGGGGYCEL